MKHDNYQIRDFKLADTEAVNDVALAAFAQYKNHYDDWQGFSNIISNMSSLANEAEIIVSTINEKIIGAVCYVPPGVSKGFFSLDWSVIRMLVVDPEHRGFGIGKSLTEECIQRAVRDGSTVIALHTSPIMKVALDMYLRLGFQFEREVSSIKGVSYNIYIKHLNSLI